MKRIKRVFTNDSAVAHLWANESQSDARCKNVFFEGRSIYSYGRHYELGRLIDVRGVRVALINTSGYSVTTSKHIGHAWDAVKHLVRVPVSGAELTSKSIRPALVEVQGKILNTLFGTFSRRMSYHVKFDMADIVWPSRMSVSEFNITCIILGFTDLILDVNDEFIALYNAHGRVMQKNQEEKYAEINAQYLRERESALKDRAERLAAWRRGESSTLGGVYPNYLRVRGNRVETTSGASASVDEVRAVLPSILNGTIEKGTPVGPFTFNSFTTHAGEDAVVIGCHTICISEFTALNLTPKLKIVADVD